ncbi:MAG: sulfatase [Phycisphaerae bacterium]
MRSISPFRANQNTPRRTSAISAKVAILLCLIAIATASTLWAIRKSPSADVKPTNVLLITMDTTRADHLGCYGHPANVTPNIDAIANEGVLFEQCMSSAPSTLPSHSAIMTSTHPFVHGARDNIGYRLSQSNTTLAEVFQEKGFKTAAFVSAAVLNRHTGIDQGFSLYVDAGDETEILGQKTCDRAIEWIRAQTENPFFAWVHFYDPHFVYEAPANFVSTAPNAYLREIAYMDAQIGRIFDELKRLGHYDDTLIVLIADHGEGLGQHGENTHLYFLYNTTISVPFVMRLPAADSGQDKNRFGGPIGRRRTNRTVDHEFRSAAHRPGHGLDVVDFRIEGGLTTSRVCRNDRGTLHAGDVDTPVVARGQLEVHSCPSPRTLQHRRRSR